MDRALRLVKVTILLNPIQVSGSSLEISQGHHFVKSNPVNGSSLEVNQGHIFVDQLREIDLLFHNHLRGSAWRNRPMVSQPSSWISLEKLT